MLENHHLMETEKNVYQDKWTMVFLTALLIDSEAWKTHETSFVSYWISKLYNALE